MYSQEYTCVLSRHVFFLHFYDFITITVMIYDIDFLCEQINKNYKKWDKNLFLFCVNIKEER